MKFEINDKQLDKYIDVVKKTGAPHYFVDGLHWPFKIRLDTKLYPSIQELIKVYRACKPRKINSKDKDTDKEKEFTSVYTQYGSINVAELDGVFAVWWQRKKDVQESVVIVEKNIEIHLQNLTLGGNATLYEEIIEDNIELLEASLKKYKQELSESGDARFAKS